MIAVDCSVKNVDAVGYRQDIRKGADEYGQRHDRKE